jgi:hypothetical protein
MDASQSVSNANYLKQKTFVINFIKEAAKSANFKAAVRQFAYWVRFCIVIDESVTATYTCCVVYLICAKQYMQLLQKEKISP